MQCFWGYIWWRSFHQLAGTSSQNIEGAAQRSDGEVWEYQHDPESESKGMVIASILLGDSTSSAQATRVCRRTCFFVFPSAHFALHCFVNNCHNCPGSTFVQWRHGFFFNYHVSCRVIRFTPFANRLAYDGIPKRIQKLRCFTNFEALQFASPIAATGQLLVKRMAAKTANSNGNYVAIHLRYEQAS